MVKIFPWSSAWTLWWSIIWWWRGTFARCVSIALLCDSNPHCHYNSPHCYQYVRSTQLLKPCASIAVQLLYAIRILTVTISVHTVTNMYGSNSC